MATTSLQLTYSEIRSHIALMAPFSRTTSDWSGTTIADDIALMLRSGLRKAYYPPAMSPGETPHQWSFLRPSYLLSTNAKYDTGTIAVVSGAVVLSGGTWPSWAIHGWLAYGGKYYEVSVRTSGTLLTLANTDSSADTAAGTTYELLQYRFVMPDNFESLEGPIYWSPDESLSNCPLTRRSDNYLRMLYQDSNTDTFEQEPKFYALLPYSTALTAAQTWAMTVWPAVHDVIHFKFRYNVQMFDLDATDAYPPGGAQHSEMILEACLSEVELKYNDAPGPHTEKWLALLASSIKLDRQIAEADTVGVVPIKSPDGSYRRIAVTDPGYAIMTGYTQSDFET